ncbi:MAG: putative DNA-binding domain-containing protein [Coxiellaceae bacterium]|nr:putative DNA-binding domain-containing protein [Coxiellaceae bacterium]
MSHLRELQENFQSYIIEGNPAVINQISDFERLSAQQRADLYKTSYQLRLLEIMENDFSGLYAMMGKEAFEKMGRAYIDSYPSNHFNILYFDRHFSKFLSTYEFAKPIYIEMADFEWLLGQALMAADAPQLTVNDLAKVPPEQWGGMRLTFHPSTRLIDLFTNAPEIWKAQSANEPVPKVSYHRTATTWLVWRYDLHAYFLSLNAHQAWMFTAFQAGHDFEYICNGLTEWMAEEEVAQFAALTLRDWFSEGIISEIALVA